ncbi:hypothetical protein G6L37_03905 [Agrobacterium rubi]|nr:hypothetical protein [Agrobacterium rubi]NTF24494.1 hypothetical protein [Agrobacterium rubi]
MKLHLALVLATSSVVSGCSSVRLVPPGDVPEVAQSQPDANWRPYSSGPMQSGAPGITTGRQGAWGGRTAAGSSEKVTRSALGDIRSGTAEVITNDPVVETVTGGSASDAPSNSRGWRPYASMKTARVQQPSSSVFGKGVSSSWAREYVPESHSTEFGIFAMKAAADGQARMVMPTGEVYSASVVRRNGPCSSLEIGVTEGGDLPIVARGSAEVCK